MQPLFFVRKKPDFETVIIRIMEREDYLFLRNELLDTRVGDVLFKYLHDLITERASRSAYSGEALKGFGECIQEIKAIRSKV